MSKPMNKKNPLYQQIRNGEVDVTEVQKEELNANTLKSTVASRQNKDRVSFGTKGAPTKAQLALLERYKAEKNTDIVNNTLDSIVSEQILQIQEAVNNMIKYKDTKIFKVLPKNLDETIKVYGMFAQEYFGKKNKELDGLPVYIIPTSYRQCNCCNTFQQPENFYKSKSNMYSGRLPICINCCTKMFEQYMKQYNDIREVLILMCQKLDYLVYEPVITQFVNYYNSADGKQEFIKHTFFSNFISELLVKLYLNQIPDEDCTFAKSNLNGIPFKNIAQTYNMPIIYNDKIITDEQESENTLSSKRIKKLKREWGDYNVDDLLWLEEKKEEWYNDYDIQGKAREVLVQQICLEELQIYNGRQQKKDVSKQIANLQNMMKTSELTPKQQSTLDKKGQWGSLGELIKFAEKEKPIINKNSDFVDVDGIERIWKSITGAISRTAGIQNEYVKEFEDNYKEYSVNMNVNDEDE